jgi:Peptidase family M49
MRIWLIAAVITVAVGCSGAPAPEEAKKDAAMSDLAVKIAKFAPTEVSANISGLADADKQALMKVVEAAKLIDPLFLRQVWSGNAAMEAKLAADATPAGKELFHFFRINAGPWSRLDQNRVFVPGAPAKPEGAAFYPDGMTKQDFENWASSLPPAQKDAAQSFFTVIRRNDKGTLMPVPYSEAYKEYLAPAAKLLREAAGFTTNATLKKFLSLRADAFEKNDYYASDLAWMDLDAPIDVTIGPYETYEDEMFGYRAAFEAYVGVRDDAESAKLARLFAGP